MDKEKSGQASPSITGETGYLKLDTTRVSLAEYWRWKPGWQFLLLAVLKLLHQPLKPPILVPASPGITEVRRDAVPGPLLQHLDPLIEVYLNHGRTLAFFYSVPTLGPTIGFAAALPNRDGLSLAMATAAHTHGGMRRKTAIGLVSRLRSGRFLATGQGDTFFTPPPDVESLRLPGRPLEELIQRHDHRVQQRRSEVVPVGDPKSVILDLQDHQMRFNLLRGVYVPASTAEIQQFNRRMREGT